MSDWGAGYSVFRPRLQCHGNHGVSWSKMRWALQTIAVYNYNRRNGTKYALPRQKEWTRANRRDKTYFGERRTARGRRKATRETNRVLRLWKKRGDAKKEEGPKETLQYMARIYNMGGLSPRSPRSRKTKP